MQQIMDWAWNHPSDAGWALFGALTALVAVFTAMEQKLADFVAKSKGGTDNKIFKTVAAFVHAIAYVLRLVRLFTPVGVARGRKLTALSPSIPPPAPVQVTVDAPVEPVSETTPVTKNDLVKPPEV